MNLTVYSRNRILQTMAEWELPRDYVDPMYNYLVFGFDPGSFFSCVLANDCWGAIQRSHPSNQIESLKRLVGWIQNYVPVDACGDHQTVVDWHRMSDSERRAILERKGLVLRAKDETWAAISGSKLVDEPVFF